MTGKEVAVVGAREEARLLALAPVRGSEAGSPRLRTRVVLRLLPEREPEAGKEARIEPGEHVGLILLVVGPAREKHALVALDGPSVVAGDEPRCADAPRKSEELGETKGAVAADARVRRLPARIPGDEGRDDGAPELLAKVERDVGEPEPVARLTCGDHRLRRAARPFGGGPGGIDPQPERHADRIEALVSCADECDGAVDPAAHGNGDSARVLRSSDERRQGVMEGIARERIRADRRRLEGRQPADLATELADTGPFAVGGDDAAVLAAEPDPGEVPVAGRVADALVHRPTVPKRKRAPLRRATSTVRNLANQVGVLPASVDDLRRTRTPSQ